MTLGLIIISLIAIFSILTSFVMKNNIHKIQH